MKKAKLTLAGLILTCCLSGCFLMGKNKELHPFDTNHISELKIGTTTAAQVCEMFGAPTEMIELSNGNAYLYQRSVAKGTALSLILISFGNYDKQYDQMVFFFDAQNRLTHFGVSLNADKVAYGFPF